MIKYTIKYRLDGEVKTTSIKYPAGSIPEKSVIRGVVQAISIKANLITFYKTY